MKFSVSLPDEDLAILDDYTRAAGLASRSAAVRLAVRMLRLPELEQDYASAWDEWEAAGDREAWEFTSADGIADAAR